MGITYTKLCRSRLGGGGGGGGRSNSDPPGAYTSELTSFDEASRSDPGLHSFGSAVRDRAQAFLLSIGSDIPSSAVSLSSLRAVTSVLIDTNQDSVNIILSDYDYIRAHPELYSLVRDFFKSSLLILKFCLTLSSRLQEAKDRLIPLRFALSLHDANGDAQRTLEELRRFREGEDPFDENFFRLILSVWEQQNNLMNSLRTSKSKLDLKLRNTAVWRRISNVILITAFVAVLVCSVVAASLSAPPVVTALLAAGTTAVGPLGKWFDSLWKGHQKRLKEEGEVIEMIKHHIVVEDLRSIGAMVQRLTVEMENLTRNVEFAERGEEEVRFVVEEVRRKMEEFVNTVEDVEKRSNDCRDFVLHARKKVLERIGRTEVD